MDFEVTIDKQLSLFDTFHPMMEEITRQVSQWNAYDPQEPLLISIRKVKNQTETLGIAVDDSLQLDDAFGGLPEGMSEEDYFAQKS